MVGIVAYGVYGRGSFRPRQDADRYAPPEAHRATGQNSTPMRCEPAPEHAAAGTDEDHFTMSLAALDRLRGARFESQRLGGCFVETDRPLVENRIAALLAAAVGAHDSCHTTDLVAHGGFAALDVCVAFVKSKMIDLGLCVAANRGPTANRTRCAASGSPDAAAAFVLGRREPELLATIEGLRLSRGFVATEGLGGGALPPGEDAGEHILLGLVRRLLAQTHLRPGQFAQLVLHGPSAADARELGRALGFADAQLNAAPAAVAGGGSAAGLCRLAAALDRARPNEWILAADAATSGGATAVILRTTDRLAASEAVAAAATNKT